MSDIDEKYYTTDSSRPRYTCSLYYIIICYTRGGGLHIANVIVRFSDGIIIVYILLFIQKVLGRDVLIKLSKTR